MLQGQTALMLACDQGQLAAMRILVAYGARYNVQDKGVCPWSRHAATSMCIAMLQASFSAMLCTDRCCCLHCRIDAV